MVGITDLGIEGFDEIEKRLCLKSVPLKAATEQRVVGVNSHE